ncbi:hypothetical protein [Nostoc sp.]|uniref:hypothetical protein n=1 Tax=Nostoc sp. TaxID=1180 RepID=UPI002FF7AD0F
MNFRIIRAIALGKVLPKPGEANLPEKSVVNVSQLHRGATKYGLGCDAFKLHNLMQDGDRLKIAILKKAN